MAVLLLPPQSPESQRQVSARASQFRMRGRVKSRAHQFHSSWRGHMGDARWNSQNAAFGFLTHSYGVCQRGASTKRFACRESWQLSTKWSGVERTMVAIKYGNRNQNHKWQSWKGKTRFEWMPMTLQPTGKGSGKLRTCIWKKHFSCGWNELKAPIYFQVVPSYKQKPTN